MTISQWILFFFVLQIIHFLGTWKLYQKAGRKSWEAAIPIYNAVILMKIINRPTWWTILLFIPVINLIMFGVIWVETLRSFGKNTPKDTYLGVLTLGFYIFTVNYNDTAVYIKDRSLKPKTTAGEWTSSILFAIVAATLVHTYVMQPFVIPTSSLEKTLLVGDFLFVSKFHYGARVPTTPIAAPMVHDTIPVIKTKSYSNTPKIPYLRLPKLQKIKRNDIVVFNWPVDTVRFFRDNSNIHVDKPLDKKSNYVKRCVAIAGDSLEVRDGYVFINGKKSVLPHRSKIQFSYTVEGKGKGFSPSYLYKRYGITDPVYRTGPTTYLFVSVTEQEAAKLKNHPNVAKITRNISPKQKADPSIFPYSKDYPFNNDNFGPIYIPQAGKTVAITQKTLPFYKRIIEEYENNTLEVSADAIKINGKIANTYTFKQDYYWMMGDNRHNSEDARTWGYVPFDHVVGKPVFIWMSWDNKATGIANKIRWERLFTTVGGDGEPVSYLRYFILALLGWYAFKFIRKKKKNN